MIGFFLNERSGLSIFTKCMAEKEKVDRFDM